MVSNLHAAYKPLVSQGFHQIRESEEPWGKGRSEKEDNEVSLDLQQPDGRETYA
jgi:hypothetical protein